MLCAPPGPIPAGAHLAHQHSQTGGMLAHEIGHLLLGKGSHSKQGLMLCPWGKDQIKGAARGRLRLSQQESRRAMAAMRERTLAARTYAKQ